VAAVFGDSFADVRPFKIRWNGREYAITKVGYVSRIQEGKTIYHAFSVTDGTGFFELLFNSDELSWLVGRIQPKNRL